MAKRMTDAGKWNKRWFRTLPPHLKLMWLYICDSCDAAGIWSEDLELASFQIGIEISQDQYFEAFGNRFIRLDDDKVFVPGFIEFQYGELSEECKPHQSVLKTLARYGICPKTLTLLEGYPKGIRTLKDKDKEKDKEKEKEKGECEGKTETLELDPVPNIQRFDFEALYEKYPLKVGKAEGIKRCKAQIKSQAEYDALSLAIDRYSEHCRKNDQFIKQFDSFLGTKARGFPWRDWTDPETGKSPVGKSSTGVDASYFDFLPKQESA